MKSMVGLFLLTSTTLMQLQSCPLPSPGDDDPQTVTFNDSFEEGFGGWTGDADVPQDPNRPGQTVLWSITLSNERSADGTISAKYALDGSQGDGTIWLARSFDVARSTNYTANLRFKLWSQGLSDNTLAKVAAYASASAPDAEGDFDVSKAANLTAGWRQYTYSFDTRSSSNGRLWVAFGISAVFESDLTYYIDDVEIELVPE